MSWQITIDEPEDLHFVLVVRDCCRLATGAAGTPGPLAPPVPDLSGLLDEPVRRAAEEAWPTWWDAALAACRAASGAPHDASSAARHLQLWQRHAVVDGPQFESLSGTPALRDAARAALDPFRRWWAPPILSEPQAKRYRQRPLGGPGVRESLIRLHLGRSTVHDVVTRVERELGREARPFDLRIDILAVTEPPVLVQDEHHALISGELAGSETGYRDWLYAAIGAVA